MAQGPLFPSIVAKVHELGGEDFGGSIIELEYFAFVYLSLRKGVSYAIFERTVVSFMRLACQN